jgi:ketosteroid isomerase-like protein
MTDAALADRLEQLEARMAIQDLASRYAIAVDSKDIEALSRLYVDDFVVAPGQIGREAVKARFRGLLQSYRRTVHLIVGQSAQIETPERASGTVYCRAESERTEGWTVTMIGYFDRYERRGGEWLIAARQLRIFYERPLAPAPLERFGLSPDPEERIAHLPHHWPSFGAFWEGAPGPGAP